MNNPNIQDRLASARERIDRIMADRNISRKEATMLYLGRAEAPATRAPVNSLGHAEPRRPITRDEATGKLTQAPNPLVAEFEAEALADPGFEFQGYGTPMQWDSRHTPEQAEAERERYQLREDVRETQPEWAAEHPEEMKAYRAKIAELTKIIGPRLGSIIREDFVTI